MRVYGPYGVILLIMEAPKLKKKVEFHGRILKKLKILILMNYLPYFCILNQSVLNLYSVSNEIQLILMRLVGVMVQSPSLKLLETSSSPLAVLDFFCILGYF